MLAIVSAERQRSSALGSRRIFTIVRSPPRSVIVRRISAFVLISFRIFNAPICVRNHTVPVPRCDRAGGGSTAPPPNRGNPPQKKHLAVLLTHCGQLIFRKK